MKVRHRTTYYALSLVAGDVLAVFLALSVAFWVKFHSGWLPSPHGIPKFDIYLRVFGVVMLFLAGTFRAYGLYAEEKIAKFWDEVGLVARAATVTALLLLALSFFFRDFEFSRGFLFVAWAFILVFVLGMRTLLSLAYVGYRRRHNKLREVLIVGAGRAAVRYALRHMREPRNCTRVIGFLDPRHPRLATYRRMPVFGAPADLERVLNDNENINEVIVALPEMPHARIIETMTLCEKHLVSFKWLPDILGLVATQMNVRYEFGLPLLYCKESPLIDWENRLLKRAMDVLLSALALVVLSPLLAIVAAAIRSDSKGSVFYKQERVGEDGRNFMLYKFRTMKENAEKDTGPV